MPDSRPLAREVYFQVSHPQHVRLTGPAAPQYGPNARQPLGERERLDQVVGAHLEPAYAVALNVTGLNK